jgi:hypothetical protein
MNRKPAQTMLVLALLAMASLGLGALLPSIQTIPLAGAATPSKIGDLSSRQSLPTPHPWSTRATFPAQRSGSRTSRFPGTRRNPR